MYICTAVCGHLHSMTFRKKCPLQWIAPFSTLHSLHTLIAIKRSQGGNVMKRIHPARGKTRWTENKFYDCTYFKVFGRGCICSFWIYLQTDIRIETWFKKCCMLTLSWQQEQKSRWTAYGSDYLVHETIKAIKDILNAWETFACLAFIDSHELNNVINMHIFYWRTPPLSTALKLPFLLSFSWWEFNFDTIVVIDVCQVSHLCSP